MATTTRRQREMARAKLERQAQRRLEQHRRARRRNMIVGIVVAAVAVLGGVIALALALGGGSSSKSATSYPALKNKPVVAVPTGAAPKTLQIKDLVTGSGRAAKTGDKLSVHYVGVHYVGGKEFDSSWKGGSPTAFPVTLGSGGVIKGWDQGLVGMKAGGRRQLIIPPALAYGSAGSPPDIKANETLIFVIDLLKIG